ncbi:hypothetical protein BY458DRAFT_492980 [Sporodiniella umbellata]|nr:hypothetical protein BY458DRAFT_492980 [Sporodiniella umbellata]
MVTEALLIHRAANLNLRFRLRKLDCTMKEHNIRDVDSLNNILTEYFQRTKKKKKTIKECDVEEIPKDKPKSKKEFAKSNQDKEAKNSIVIKVPHKQIPRYMTLYRTI